jgi:hypothetical protein
MHGIRDAGLYASPAAGAASGGLAFPAGGGDDWLALPAENEAAFLLGHHVVPVVAAGVLLHPLPRLARHPDGHALEPRAADAAHYIPDMLGQCQKFTIMCRMCLSITIKY